jgi:signal transduction histidine kinase
MTLTRQRLKELGLPVLIAVASVSEVLVSDIRPTGIAATAEVLAALSLTGRYRYPAAAGLLAISIIAAESASGVDMSKPVMGVVVLGVSAYGFGHRLALRSGLGTCALAVAVVALSTVIDPTTVTGANPVFAGVLASGAFAMGRVLRTRTRALQSAAVASRDLAVVQERARIARELHDLLAHSLSVMVVQASAAEQLLGPDPVRARTAMQAVQRAGRDALDETARLLDLLRQGPSDSVPQPGLADLPGLAARLPSLELALSVAEGLPSLPPGGEVNVYRVVQEALANVVKHSAASRATVSVGARDGELVVEVHDAGPARRGSGLAGGYGVLGMRERVNIYGGRLCAGPDGDGGWRVRAQFPQAEVS